MTDVLIDARRGAGSSLEILYGTVTWKPTLTHSRGTSVVLPAPTTFDLVDGQVVATNVQPSPDPVEGQVEWAYEVTFKDRHSKSYSFLVGVPDSTSQVNFIDLPRYFETKPPLFGQGPQGIPGEAATVAVGTVTGGSTAQVNNSGTNTDAVLDFVLPQGPQGPPGLGVDLAPSFRPAEDLPETYDNGVTVHRIGGVSEQGTWPLAFATVTTFKNGDGRVHQTIVNSALRVFTRVQTGTVWTGWREGASADLATTTANGLMSSADKSRLEGITPLANTKTFSALASTYPSGVSIVQVRVSDGWPLTTTGTVITHKTATDSTAVGQWLYPVEGGEPLYRSSNASGLWSDFSAVATQSWVKDNAGQAGVINVKDYGAVGDGITDDFEAVQSAFEAVQAGQTIFFPEGTYYTSYKTPSVQTNWLIVDKDNVTVSGEGETTILDNFLLYIKGSYGAKINLGQAATTGDRSLTSATAHGGQSGDYYQLLSCVNAYSPDGGEWQLGSTSPTSGVRPNTRYTEIVQVADVISSTSLRLLSEIVYPTYPTTSTGLSFPMTGITRTELRKLNMVKGVTIQKMTFRNISTSSFRQIAARVCADLTFREVNMVSGPLPGATLRVLDSYNVLIDDCVARKDLDTTGGSSWNTVFIGGGSQVVKFRNFRGYNQAQCIDITPNNMNTSDWAASPDSLETMSTMQFSSLEGCSFFGCGDGVTSHPGTYSFSVRGSLFEAGSTGVRARSKKSVIQSNIINTARSGVALSAFVHDSMISDNVINIAPSEKYAGYWQGISYSMCSSEIMNENNISGLVIRGNSIEGREGNSVDSAISLSYTPPANLPEFTNAVKVRRSQITIADNRIFNSSVVVGEFINGTTVLGNTFSGGSSKSHYLIFETNSAANHIPTNTFMVTGGPVTGSISTGNVTATGHGYSTLHRVAEQLTYGGSQANNLLNTGPVFAFSSKDTLRDGLTLASSGTLSATRDSGAATLNLDAVPNDGVSGATVRMFQNNPSTGSKELIVYGRTRSDEYRFSNLVRMYSDAGDPNGSVTASIGSIYLRTDGGATTTLYVKTSGSGNTGWTAK